MLTPRLLEAFSKADRMWFTLSFSPVMFVMPRPLRLKTMVGVAL